MGSVQDVHVQGEITISSLFNYLALFGPTDWSSNEELAVIAESGIFRFSIPNEFSHFAEKKEENNITV